MAQLPIDYTSKDYEAFRNDLINLIPRILPKWTDFSQSDPGIALIELFAYIGDIISYYQDRNANESYLPTATQRRSIIDICKALDYRLRPAIPSRTLLTFEIQPQATDFVIPRGFVASTEQTQYEDAIYFETDQDLVIPAGSTGLELDGEGNYLYAVPATQGTTIFDEIVGSSTGTPLQSFPLKYPNVINAPALGFASLMVYVNEGAGFELWTNGTDIIDVPETNRYFTTETDENDITWIQFGDGVNGKIPAEGINNIRATYRVGGGFHTNVGTDTVTVMQTSIPGVVSVRNGVPATGGLDAETIEEARVLAPRSFQAKRRAVTQGDYEAVALSVPGVAKARAVRDKDHTNQMNVHIAPVGGGMPSQELQQEVFELLDDVKVILTNVAIKEPKYVRVNISLKAQLQPGYPANEVKAYIDEMLVDTFAFENREFGQEQYVSSMYHLLNTVAGVRYVELERFTIEPEVEPVMVSGNPEWSRVTVNPVNDLDGKWKVVMTSATEFDVLFDEDGNDSFSAAKGSGTFGTEFTSSGGEITFTITAGDTPCSQGDFWLFRTTPYYGNIRPEENEILLLNVDDYETTLMEG